MSIYNSQHTPCTHPSVCTLNAHFSSAHSVRRDVEGTCSINWRVIRYLDSREYPAEAARTPSHHLQSRLDQRVKKYAMAPVSASAHLRLRKCERRVRVSVKITYGLPPTLASKLDCQHFSDMLFIELNLRMGCNLKFRMMMNGAPKLPTEWPIFKDLPLYRRQFLIFCVFNVRHPADLTLSAR